MNFRFRLSILTGVRVILTSESPLVLVTIVKVYFGKMTTVTRFGLERTIII